MTKQTAVVVALWALGGAGILATIVAAILLWRDVRAGGERHDSRPPEPTEEDR